MSLTEIPDVSVDSRGRERFLFRRPRNWLQRQQASAVHIIYQGYMIVWPQEVFGARFVCTEKRASFSGKRLDQFFDPTGCGARKEIVLGIHEYRRVTECTLP